MMRLFEVPTGRKVRITSERIRYADVVDGERVIKTLSGQQTWTGITSGHYWMFEGVQRRLITDHSIECEYLVDGVWQRDCECYVIG